ncbi:MAG: hypothetical protein IJ011_06095 [Clostridia bacterium]|nr:hypothetical protein [Clostridia bacterium]
MKKGVHIDIKLSEDLLRKLLYISEAENRTPNAQFAFMLRNNIAYFEKTKGRISPAELSKIDISDYIEEEN